MQEDTHPLPPKVSQPSENNTGGSRKRSWVWDHFSDIVTENPDAKRRACSYCLHSYACDPKQNGTTSWSNHLENPCPRCSYRKVDKGQTSLEFKPKTEGDTTSGLMPISSCLDKCRQALAEMLIIDEMPFRFVEGDGFRNFMFTLQPKWTRIPSRVTIARDCYKVYLREKELLKNALKGQRVCLTVDTSTSLQNLNYMCLTAHFIDHDWILNKKILNFCIVESHEGLSLGMAVEMCLLDWGIDKILTLTVDNSSSNNSMVDFLKRETMNRKGTILQHEFLHMRCWAHILNLVVREGLKDRDEIARVRNVVRYVRSSPQRLKTFKLCAQKEKLQYKSKVVLDEPTMWDSTYVMLDRAEKYQRVFERFEEEDINFLTSTRVEFAEGGDDGTNRRARMMPLGPLTNEDWDKCRLIVKFLKRFYDATLMISGSNRITCNAFCMKVVNIQGSIKLKCDEGELYLQSMAENMKLEFQKYWGNLGNMNPLLYVALVLDPRWKLKFIEFVYGESDPLTRKVKDALIRLFEVYVAKEVDCIEQDSNGSQSNEGSGSPEDWWASDMAEFRKYSKEVESKRSKKDLENYLAESLEKHVDGFDVLGWWKLNSGRYRVLSLIARHVLAIPVSTMASKSVFTTKGRVLDSFHSSLSPNMVEARICVQDWLCSLSSPISLRDAMEDVEESEIF